MWRWSWASGDEEECGDEGGVDGGSAAWIRAGLLGCLEGPGSWNAGQFDPGLNGVGADGCCGARAERFSAGGTLTIFETEDPAHPWADLERLGRAWLERAVVG